MRVLLKITVILIAVGLGASLDVGCASRAPAVDEGRAGEAAPAVDASPRAADVDPQTAVTSSDEAAPRSAAPPTLATAGAEICRIEQPVALGAGAADEIVVGFGPELGLAAFRSAPATLSMRVVAADGALVGDLMTATIVDEGRPRWVFWLDPGFVVLVMDWDWRGARVAWSALLVRPGQPPTPAVDLGLDGMDVRVARALDRRSVGLIVQAAAISRADEPGRWQTIAVAEDGSIRSTAIAVDLDDLVTRTDERWAPAELDGARGWVAVREGEEPTEGVFAGRRVATDAAAARTDADAVVASIINGAVPPPRGPGGTIFEARGEPLLVRSRGADEVGEPLLMAWRGDVVGAVAMNVSTALFWSGSRFLYAYDGPKGAMILPIDCRRPPLR